jgi:hypothetical protein
MNEKHLDCKRKEIQIGDIVLIKKHGFTCGVPNCQQCEKESAYVGYLGVVTTFGCIQVEVSNLESKSLKTTIIICLNDKDVEIVGNIR